MIAWGDWRSRASPVERDRDDAASLMAQGVGGGGGGGTGVTKRVPAGAGALNVFPPFS